ncbi:MAG TPA: ThiF family adenylyltransferase [Bacteroidia bacterium]|nr:ThiF family adenylyltransferase [Bacteroidia bacterium]
MEINDQNQYPINTVVLQISLVKKHIRIKPYFHVLQNEQVVDFVKTLQEGIQLPAGNFFDVFLESISTSALEEEILKKLSSLLNVPGAMAKQLLEKLFELGVLEYYEEEVPGTLNRYHRQLLLFDSIHPKNNFEENYTQQKKLQDAHVLIMGIGGIGNFIATALATAGAGKITLVDYDVVEETNLNRQILFSENDIGKNKAEAAAKRLKELNSNCEINCLQKEISSIDEFENLLQVCNGASYIVLSADKPVDLVLWASALCKKYLFKYIKCGYMAYQGLIGPLLGYNTKPYGEIFQSWAEDIRSQNDLIKSQNENHIAPSMAATNAILANIAAWELIKDITGICESSLIEKRILFNLKTMEMVYG